MTLTRMLEQQMPDGSVRWMDFAPAWDKKPKKPGDPNYGVYGAEITFGISRGRLTCTFMLMTDWMLPHVIEDWRRRGLDKQKPYDGLGSIDIHSPVSTWEDDTPIKDCKYTGGKCYCSGSSLAARDLFQKWITEGPEVVWKELESWLDDHEGKVKEEKENARNFS